MAAGISLVLVLRKNVRRLGGTSDGAVFMVKSVQDRAGDDRNRPVEAVPVML